MPETITRIDQPQRGLILAESAALKAKLAGIYVPRSDEPRRVRTYFRYPDEQTERIYPFITIEFMTLQFANDRAHSVHWLPVEFWPSEYASFAEYAEANGITGWTGRVGEAEALYWHPYNLLFQISTYSRDPLDQIYLDGLLVGTHYIPDRWGYLYIPEDDTTRWLDRIDMRTANYIEGNPQGMDQTVFRTAFTVSISAFVPPDDPVLYIPVLQVIGTLIKISQRPGATPEVYETWINEPTAAP